MQTLTFSFTDIFEEKTKKGCQINEQTKFHIIIKNQLFSKVTEPCSKNAKNSQKIM